MATYQELIKESYPFPNEEFKIEDDNLSFNDVDIQKLINKHGTPLRITYLPKISKQISKGKEFFKNAFEKHKYQGEYLYTYCTKSSHFKFVIEETLKNGAHLETSSAFDIAIIKRLYKENLINESTFVIANGFKRALYTKYLCELINDGFYNCIPVIDNVSEIEIYNEKLIKKCQIGIRVATEEEPGNKFETSRLGIRKSEVLDFFKNKIALNKNLNLKLLHFFINTGIQDSAYYWNELTKLIELYCELKKIAPYLDSIDIGGGLPIKTSLTFSYDYQEVINKIIGTIKSVCDKNNVATPNIISEFGSFTIGESGAMIYKILDQKLQNDKELWYMIDGSFITNLPDTWALKQQFILLAINNWSNGHHKVNLGGLTCDGKDYYNKENHSGDIFLPKVDANEDQYIGFFHTGAYQEALGGYGGVQHCLIPSAKHLILSKNENGDIIDTVYREEEVEETMLSILGY